MPVEQPVEAVPTDVAVDFASKRVGIRSESALNHLPELCNTGEEAHQSHRQDLSVLRAAWADWQREHRRHVRSGRESIPAGPTGRVSQSESVSTGNLGTSPWRASKRRKRRASAVTSEEAAMSWFKSLRGCTHQSVVTLWRMYT